MRPQKPPPLLVVHQLHVWLPSHSGRVHAVDGVSMVLQSGKIMGLVGESGCGKSLFGRAIMGLLPTGAVLSAQSEMIYRGVALNRCSRKRLRNLIGKEIAMVFQDPMTSLNPVMRIGHQIAESIVQHERGKKRAALARAARLLQSVGIDGPEQHLQRYPHELSGGQRQRVALAIALACNPALLIADEPTTALDVTVKAEILDILKRHCASDAMAMLLISHDLSVVAGRTDETAVMYAGRIIECRPTADLFRNPRVPYTRALLAARPLLSKPAHSDLATIGGQPPDLITPPPGCRFSPRCPNSRAKCRSAAPPFERIQGTHYGYACWYPHGGSERRLQLRRTIAQG